MKQPPDQKYLAPSASLPPPVRDLSCGSNRPVVYPDYLFFRESKPTFVVPEFTTRGKHDSWGPFALDHHIFYLWQNDGSLAVYAYLFIGEDVDPAACRAYGCVHLGFVGPDDWTLGGA